MSFQSNTFSRSLGLGVRSGGKRRKKLLARRKKSATEASLLSLPIFAVSPRFLPFPPTTMPGPRLIFPVVPWSKPHGLVRLLSNCCLKILVVIASDSENDGEHYNV